MAYLVSVTNCEDNTYVSEFPEYIDAKDHYDYLCKSYTAKKLYTKIYLCEILEKKEVANERCF